MGIPFFSLSLRSFIVTPVSLFLFPSRRTCPFPLGKRLGVCGGCDCLVGGWGFTLEQHGDNLCSFRVFPFPGGKRVLSAIDQSDCFVVVWVFVGE